MINNNFRKLDYIAFFIIIFISIFIFIPIQLMDSESVLKSIIVITIASFLHAAVFGTITNLIFKKKKLNP